MSNAPSLRWPPGARRYAWRGALLAIASVLALGLIACEDDNDDIEVGDAETPTTTTDGTASATGTTSGADVPGPADVDELSQVAIGSTVQFSAPVQNIIGPGAFTAEGSGGDLDEDTLILLPSSVDMPADMVAADGDGTVDVVGSVIEVVVTDLGDDPLFDFRDDELDAFGDWDGDRAVVADSVTFVGGQPDADVEPDEIGQTVTVNGEIDTVFSDRMFSIGGDSVLGLGIFGGSTVLVMVPDGVTLDPASLAEDTPAEATGTVVELIVTDVEGDYFADTPFTSDEESAFDQFDTGDLGVVASEVTIIEP